MSDDYLWNRSGDEDADIRDLENVLGALRYERPLEATVTAAPRHHRRRYLMLAAAVAASVVGGWFAVGRSRSAPTPVAGGGADVAPARGCHPAISPEQPWAVSVLAGSPSCGAAQLERAGVLEVGGVVETDDVSAAEVAVADIGRVILEPGGRLSLKTTGPREHRLALERGRIRAAIDAPPRLFLVETPTALAVDLGCEYTLEVDSEGASHLHVTAGFVSLENGEWDAFVPAGYRCDSLPGKGPGLPYIASASEDLQRAIAAFHGSASDESLDRVLTLASSKSDALTLWHLLAWDEGAHCERVTERLAQTTGLHVEATCHSGNAVEAWREAIEHVWEDTVYRVDELPGGRAVPPGATNHRDRREPKKKATR